MTDLRAEIQDALRNDLGRARKLVARFAKLADTPQLRAEAMFQRAKLADMTGRTREAAARYAKARAAFAKLGVRDYVLATDVGAVQAHAELGEADAVRRCVRRLRQLDLRGARRAGVEIAIGTALETLGDDKRAEESYREALARLKGRDRRTRFLRATARQNMTICMVRRGAVAPALREIDRALAAFVDLGLDGPAEIARFTRGWAHGIAGHAREAFADLTAAQAAFQASGRAHYAALAQIDEAELRRRLGDDEGAAELARAARRALPPLEAARARLLEGKRGAKRVRDVLLSLGDKAGAARATLLAGGDLAAAERTLLRHGNSIAALEALLARARDPRMLARRIKLYPPVLRRWVEPEIWHLRARGPKRIANLRRAVRAVEDLRRRAPSGTLRATTLDRHLAIYEELAEALLERGHRRDLREAFLVLDAARVRTLREEMDREAPGLMDRPGVRELRERIEALWRTLERREGEDPKNLRSFQASLLREVAGVEREFLRAVERESDASGPPTELPADPCLAFSVVGGQVVGMLCDGAVQAWDAGPLASLREDLDAFLFQVNRRLYGGGDVVQASAPLERIARRLLGPAEFGRALRVVLPPELGSLPVEALIPETTITYAPFACVRGPRWRRGGKALVVGIETAALPEVRREIAAVRRRLGAADVLRSADRATVLSHLPGRRIVHIAGHAEARDDAPLLSALRLRDGWLAAADLGDVALDRALVVLSACRTGDPSLRWQGESMAGFPRALLAAGAAGVIASRWEIQDDVARDWMVYFYRELENAGPADALAAAARRVRRRWPHPADWAAFLCISRAAR